jgi:hypothetical protein
MARNVTHLCRVAPPPPYCSPYRVSYGSLNLCRVAVQTVHDNQHVLVVVVRVPPERVREQASVQAPSCRMRIAHDPLVELRAREAGEARVSAMQAGAPHTQNQECSLLGKGFVFSGVPRLFIKKVLFAKGVN